MSTKQEKSARIIVTKGVYVENKTGYLNDVRKTLYVAVCLNNGALNISISDNEWGVNHPSDGVEVGPLEQFIPIKVRRD